MKKLLLFLLVLTLVGCGTQTKQEENKELDTSMTDNYKKAEIFDRVTTIETVTYEELIEKMNSSTDFLLYIGRPDCPDCQEFYPLMEEYLEEEGFGIYYLNIKDFRDAAKQEDATEEQIAFYENLQETLEFNWVPSLQRWIDGELVDSYQYLSIEYYEIESMEEKEQEKEDYIEQFKDWFLIHYRDEK